MSKKELNKYMPKVNIDSISAPFVFSSSYVDLEYYDADYHWRIFTPLTGMLIGRRGVCDGDTHFDSAYPLFPDDYCPIVKRFRSFDSAKVSDLLKYNGRPESTLLYLNEYLDSEYSTLNGKLLLHSIQYTVLLVNTLFSPRTSSLLNQ